MRQAHIFFVNVAAWFCRVPHIYSRNVESEVCRKNLCTECITNSSKHSEAVDVFKEKLKLTFVRLKACD